MKAIYAVTTVIAIMMSAAQPALAISDRCKEGYVWREAFPGDKVCVTPGAREQAAQDNRAAGSRYRPGGGKYGPDTCRRGYVWREARPNDHVCVTPAVRIQTAHDNKMAHTRVAQHDSHHHKHHKHHKRHDHHDHHDHHKHHGRRPIFIECPVRDVRVEITTHLPRDWWQTPQQGRLKRTSIDRIGGEPALVCHYRAYGRTVPVMRKMPRRVSRCIPKHNGFECD